MSQSKGSTVLCELELHALSKKTMLNISLNPGLNLTIILGTGPRCGTVGISDHCAIFGIRKLHRLKFPPPKTVKARNYKNYDPELFP